MCTSVCVCIKFWLCLNLCEKKWTTTTKKPDILKWLNMSCYCGYLLKTINAFTESEDRKWSSKMSSFLRAMTASGNQTRDQRYTETSVFGEPTKKILGEGMVVTFQIPELSYKTKDKVLVHFVWRLFLLQSLGIVKPHQLVTDIYSLTKWACHPCKKPRAG